MWPIIYIYIYTHTYIEFLSCIIWGAQYLNDVDRKKSPDLDLSGVYKSNSKFDLLYEYITALIMLS